MNLLTNKEFTPIILDEYTCCRNHLWKLKLVSKKVNNFIVNQLSYYKVLLHLTEKIAVDYKNEMIYFSHKFYNTNASINNITSYNLSLYEDSDNESNISYETESVSEDTWEIDEI